MTVRAGMLTYLLALLLTACGEDKPKTLTLPNTTDRFINSGQLALSTATTPIPALETYWQKVQQRKFLFGDWFRFFFCEC